ncbi:hypothetical protein [Butyrivibrio sp. AE3006]|uniref:hypothetical protein n=1 Tax=Butyrivibrio sp. AE3006 TaxID=1280673 RepID=UPI0003FBD30B|nr:hypothetical protein [Butyrivibrio sp. AE3006]
MKKINYFLARLVFAAAFLLCIFNAWNMSARAAVKCDDTVEVIYYKGGYYATGNDYLFDLETDARGDDIINLKTSCKHLKVFRVSYEEYTESTKMGIGIWTDKKGKYTFEFDVITKNGVIKDHKVITVKVRKPKTLEQQEPCKKVMYAKKNLLSDNFYSLLRIPKKGKLKITMKKGYKLLEVWYGETNLEDSNKADWHRIKNNTVIKLSNRHYQYHSSNGKFRNDLDRMEADTFIWIKYQNKKTKEISSTYYTISRLVNFAK